MDKLQVGRIVRPQGIRGEVKVQGDTDDVRRFLELGEVYLDAAETPTAVLSSRVSGSDVFLSLSGCADRNAAEKLRGVTLSIDRENAVSLPADTYFVADILGAEVWTDTGVRLGVVRDILQHGAADVYVLDNGAMFPFLKDVATDVDLEARKITVNAIRFGEVAVHAD